MAQSMAQGMDPAEVAFYSELGERIVDHEMRLRAKHTAHLPEEQDAQATLRMVQAARAMRIYVVDRLFMRRVAGAEDLKDERLQR